MTDFLNMNIYSSSMMSDKLLSPLDKECSQYYTYLLDSIVDEKDIRRYKISILPKFRSTQLVKGYIWVNDEVWTIHEVQFDGKFDMIEFRLNNIMGKDGDEEFLPVKLNLRLFFNFMGNLLEMNANAWVKYNMVNFIKVEKDANHKKNITMI